MEERIPEFYCEQAAVGELSPFLLQRFSADPEFLRRVESLKEENRRFLQERPAPTWAADPEAALRASEIDGGLLESKGSARKPGIRPAVFGLAGIAAAAALFVLSIGTFRPAETDAGAIEDVIRIKGLEPILTVYRQTDRGSVGFEELESGDRVAAADTLQLRFNPGDAAYGAIVSIDGRGSITLHRPSSRTGSTRFEEAGPVSLPYGYRLDDAPNFERFLLVTSDTEFRIAQLIEIIQPQLSQESWIREGRLTLPGEFTVTAVSLRK